MADDRQQFEEQKKRRALALGADAAAFKRALETTLDLERYDYTYLWSWMGVPIIQRPPDVMALQEVIWHTKPDVIVETGVARGGSVVFMASMLELIGKGEVVGIDIDIRAHNRDTIERHPMSRRIRLVEGSSVDPATIQAVKARIPAGASVMVVLDSDHSRDHVLAELRAYAPLVSKGGYLVVSDTIVGHIGKEQASPRWSKLWYKGNEPLSALNDYLAETDRFEVDAVLNGKLVLSSSPGGFLRCIRD